MSKTPLKDRVLWFDGTSQVAPELVPQLLLAGVPLDKIAVDGVNEDVSQFNALADEPLEFGKLKNRPFSMEYKIPQAFKEINLETFLVGRLAFFLPKHAPPENALYVKRLKAELAEIELRGMGMMMRTIIYVVETLKDTDTVWGVGRGSSCASLVLFLIGLHKVDPIKYGIPMEEFFHD